MSNACAPILMGITSPVLEIPLPSKMAKIPFRTMGYSPWSSKNLIDQNRLKKFMQVWIDELCMCTNFDGHDLSDFGDTITLKNSKIPFRTMGLYSPWSSKNSIDQNRLKKFMQVRIDELCMCTNFDGHYLFGFGDTTTLKNGQNSLSDHGL